MSLLTLRKLEKSFGATTVVKSFDLSMGDAEFISLLGPSGCGKTTVLRMVAGFETPSVGAIKIDGQDVTTLRPNQRKIGMMFQSYALFPNLNVAGNVAFGLKVSGVPSEQIGRRVDQMLEMVGLTGFGARYPYQLSGGQQQRVALARAIAPRPRVLLLDEPLSALDAKIRVALRGEIRAIQRELGITTLFVTHDQEEAMAMSDRVVVMNGGRAEQVGTPDQIYNSPASRFVAGFIGALNLLPATLRDAGSGIVECALGTLDLKRGVAQSNGTDLTLAFRQESLRLLPEGVAPQGQTFTGRLVSREFLGAIVRFRAETAGGVTLGIDCFNRTGEVLPEVGHEVRLGILPQEILVLQ